MQALDVLRSKGKVVGTAASSSRRLQQSASSVEPNFVGADAQGPSQLGESEGRPRSHIPPQNRSTPPGPGRFAILDGETVLGKREPLAIVRSIRTNALQMSLAAHGPGMRLGIRRGSCAGRSGPPRLAGVPSLRHRPTYCRAGRLAHFRPPYRLCKAWRAALLRVTALA